jgi:hypothetical protein
MINGEKIPPDVASGSMDLFMNNENKIPHNFHD